MAAAAAAATAAVMMLLLLMLPILLIPLAEECPQLPGVSSVWGADVLLLRLQLQEQDPQD